MGQDTVSGTGNNMTAVNYDIRKIFVWDNRFADAQYNNDTYDDVDLALGTVMGRVASTGLLVPLDSEATDGSQFPVGVLASNYTAPAGETKDISICVAGDVEESLLIFTNESDDLDTVVSDRQLRDRIAADTVGIKLVSSTEMTQHDNS
jgi:hypothetical protein